jgi:hypothetical protein
LTVVHTFISTTPDWYVQPVTDIIRRSADFTHCRVVVTEAMPHPGEFDGPTDNPHSGKHFNGEFNRYWAEKMTNVLNDAR